MVTVKTHLIDESFITVIGCKNQREFLSCILISRASCIMLVCADVTSILLGC